ncbi:maleylpyruvate isomerase family mycothiol-dependent enzyme [Salana multivorans]
MDDDLRRIPRAALVAALRSVPPDAPTLCEGWQARHLAAHIILRERAPQRIAFGALRGHDAAIELGDDVSDVSGADDAELAHYEQLIAEVEEGPSALSPMSWSARGNVLEFVVHALDVLRASEHPAIRARELTLSPGVRSAMWGSLLPLLRIGGVRRAARAAGMGLIVVVPHGPRAVIARGEQSLVLTGTEEEIALVAMGRAPHARATVTGPDDAIATFRESLDWPAASPEKRATPRTDGSIPASGRFSTRSLVRNRPLARTEAAARQYGTGHSAVQNQPLGLSEPAARRDGSVRSAGY